MFLRLIKRVDKVTGITYLDIMDLKTEFVYDWCTCVDNVVIIPHDIIITGYLNVHVDNTSDYDATRFCSMIVVS